MLLPPPCFMSMTQGRRLSSYRRQINVRQVRHEVVDVVNVLTAVVHHSIMCYRTWHRNSRNCHWNLFRPLLLLAWSVTQSPLVGAVRSLKKVPFARSGRLFDLLRLEPITFATFGYVINELQRATSP